ncbi:MAG: rRNA maturation RNase YbeY [Patescibacteria group bacterium]|nr:rRNA maturation RNase YbeY [Patescibacteria group bacterium]
MAVKVLIKKDPRYPVNLKNVRRKITEILADFKPDENLEVSLVFVGKRKAKELNEGYRKMDYIPEVLAFPMNEFGPDGVLRLGDLVICFPLAREVAIKREKLVEEIIFELLEHGMGNLVRDLNR